MHRFFVEQKLVKDDIVFIKGEDYSHLKNSLRIKQGESIEICDGKEEAYIGTVKQLYKDSCTVLLTEKIQKSAEPLCDITLYTAILKGDRFDSLLQKCIECGVHSFKPVITSNTIVEIDEKNKSKKIERWNRVCKLACMQSKRNILVSIDEPERLDEILGHLAEDEQDKTISFVCYEAEQDHSIKRILEKAVLQGIKKINIFIGPEGGFDKSEISDMHDLEIEAVHLGKRILRADTAAACAVFYTTANYEFL